MSWLLFAVGSAFFAGITAILAKIGIQSVPSHLATALRTGVVLVFAWGMVFLVGSQGDLAQLTGGDLAWLVLSGLATGASWLCYFRALQLGDVNKVTPIDKSSTVLTILLAWLLLGEPLSLPQGLGVVAIGAGTDVAIDSADVVLVKSDPEDIVRLLDLGTNTTRKIKQNLWWGAGYNIVAIPLAAGVLAPVGILLSPAVGAVLMSLSTVIVAVNAMTLKNK